MSNLFISKDPTIFPDPEKFDPDRWSTPGSAKRRSLERHLHPFGKGSRSCVGQNMAYAEIYSTLATIFRRFPNMELYDTTPRDMEYVHDYFGGMARHDNHGLKVKIGKKKL
jgi:cytochrome P450